MNISRVDDAFEECEQHLVATNSFNTRIEAVLTAYVSAVIYSSFEAQTRAIVAARASGDNSDGHLENFARVASTRLMRSIKVSELAGTAGLFHSDCKNRFHEGLEDEVKAAWDTIIANRHGVAHDDGLGGEQTIVSNLTFGELKRLYPSALAVLEIFRDAIVKKTP